MRQPCWRRLIGLATLALFGGAGSMLLAPSKALGNEYAPQLERFLEARVRPWLADPIVVDSLRRQNAAHADLDQATIDTLDRQWRDEARSGGGPLLDEWMARDLSHFLRRQQAGSGGLVTEVFVMDGKGLNVGQSEPTSDYWQGDEAKWQQTYLVGADAVFVDEIDFDDSTGMFQSQISASIADPETGEVIGAVTVGINIEALD